MVTPCRLRSTQKVTGPAKVCTVRLEKLQRGELRLEQVPLVFSKPLVEFHLDDPAENHAVLTDQPVERLRGGLLLRFGAFTSEVGDPDVCVR